MPKQTFFNLPTTKRKLLLDAAMKEFSRVPFHDASISNIIKEAAIARGSFYQYFEDKEDLFYYLLELDTERRRRKFITQIKENDGDFFASLIDYLQSILTEDIKDEEAKQFYRHVFLNMNYKTEKTFMTNKMDAEIHQYVNEIRMLIDTSKLNLIHDDDFTQMFHIATTMMFQNIVMKFARNLSKEEVTHTFIQQLHLLKRGFLIP